MFEDVNFLLYIFVVVNVFLSLLNYRMTFGVVVCLSLKKIGVLLSMWPGNSVDRLDRKVEE